MKKLAKIKWKYFIILMTILMIYIFLANHGFTFMRYHMEVNGTAVGYGATEATIYTITYELDGGTQASGQISSFIASDLPITLLEPTKSGYTFQGWYNNSSFTGTAITTISTVGNYDLYARWVEDIYVAEANGNYYHTINEAIYAEVQANNVPVTVTILQNVTLDKTAIFDIANSNSYNGRVVVPEDKNVVLNLQNYTINNGAVIPLFEIYGTLTVSNGTFASSTTQGILNVWPTGTLYVTGGTINATGSKQAIYNNGGTLEISGNPTITNTSNNRAAVHNSLDAGVAGTITITGGTIIASNYYGVYNQIGTLTIGSKDGNVSRTSPVIQGTYGVNSTENFSFYDGILKGKTNAVNDLNKITDVETDYCIATGTETIGGKNYKTNYLIEEPVIVTFNPNGGTIDEETRQVEKGAAIGTLPVPTYTGYIFEGWYTLPSDGDRISSDTIINSDIEIFAYWVSGVAQVNGNDYLTIEEALRAVPSNNVATTITVLADITITTASTSATVGGCIKIPSGKNVILDIQNHSIKNDTALDTPVIENKGRLTIISGTVYSNGNQGTINNLGTLTVSGGSIQAAGGKQALYNNGGTATISGTASFSSTTTERATVHNLNDGTLTITGGTITSTGSYAVKNDAGTLTIGINDGTVTQTPVIRGVTTGVLNSSTFYFYDGVIYGIDEGIEGAITGLEANYHTALDNETINGQNYKKRYLAPDI